MTVASKTQAKRRGTVGALCLFVALSGALFWDVWAGGIDRTVPFSARQSDGVLIGAGMTSIQRGDSMIRTDHFDKRRGVMDVWASFCEGSDESGKVVPIKGAG